MSEQYLKHTGRKPKNGMCNVGSFCFSFRMDVSLQRRCFCTVRVNVGIWTVRCDSVFLRDWWSSKFNLSSFCLNEIVPTTFIKKFKVNWEEIRIWRTLCTSRDDKLVFLDPRDWSLVIYSVSNSQYPKSLNNLFFSKLVRKHSFCTPTVGKRLAWTQKVRKLPVWIHINRT